MCARNSKTSVTASKSMTTTPPSRRTTKVLGVHVAVGFLPVEGFVEASHGLQHSHQCATQVLAELLRSGRHEGIPHGPVAWDGIDTLGVYDVLGARSKVEDPPACRSVRVL